MLLHKTHHGFHLSAYAWLGMIVEVIRLVRQSDFHLAMLTTTGYAYIQYLYQITFARGRYDQ